MSMMSEMPEKRYRGTRRGLMGSADQGMGCVKVLDYIVLLAVDTATRVFEVTPSYLPLSLVKRCDGKAEKGRLMYEQETRAATAGNLRSGSCSPASWRAAIFPFRRLWHSAFRHGFLLKRQTIACSDAGARLN